MVELELENNVRFINKYLSLKELLEYLQLTSIYIFSSKDPNQAVSGTFLYALGSGCPVVSTPIPQAKELYKDKASLLFDFQNHEELSDAVLNLLEDVNLRRKISNNAIHSINHGVWENVAIKNANLFKEIIGIDKIEYNYPPMILDHFYRLTDDFGMIQFSNLSTPEIESGYTLDDNVRAMVAVIMYYSKSKNPKDLQLIDIYLRFIERCQLFNNGRFYNYFDENRIFTKQNKEVNLDDSNGRTLWALGVLISYEQILPINIIKKAKKIFEKSLQWIDEVKSPRTISFVIKGLYNYNKIEKSDEINDKIKSLADKLVFLYKKVSTKKWEWFENYLTYANSLLPEAMFYAYLAIKDENYKKIATESFDFLLSKYYEDKNRLQLISNRGWMQKDDKKKVIPFGQQPIDASYLILTLDLFYNELKDEKYKKFLKIAFTWFLGNNYLAQIVYNHTSGGCYDGLEEETVNLNQGAESTVCYLMARVIADGYKNNC